MISITFPTAEPVKTFLGLLTKENSSMQVKLDDKGVKFIQISENGELLISCKLAQGLFKCDPDDFGIKVYGKFLQIISKFRH